jgi:uncharacterized protein (DUF1778 family)
MTQERTARIEARITPDALLIVKRAAELQGRSLSDFVVSAAQDAAKRAVEEAQVLRLSLEDQRLFAEMLLAPQKPTEGMRKAAKAYKALIVAAH